MSSTKCVRVSLYISIHQTNQFRRDLHSMLKPVEAGAVAGTSVNSNIGGSGHRHWLVCNFFVRQSKQSNASYVSEAHDQELVLRPTKVSNTSLETRKGIFQCFCSFSRTFAERCVAGEIWCTIFRSLAMASPTRLDNFNAFRGTS